MIASAARQRRKARPGESTRGAFVPDPVCPWCAVAPTAVDDRVLRCPSCGELFFEEEPR